MTDAEITAWCDVMFHRFPQGPPPDFDTTEEAYEWLTRFGMWAHSADPEGAAAWDHYCKVEAAKEIVNEYFDELVATGEYVKETTPQGTVVYSKVGA